MKTITVLLPALNEEKAIGKVIQDIKKLPIHCDVLVVDNRSTDGTVKVSNALGAKVLHEKRKGKGNAVRTGLKHISTDYVVMIDADGTYPVDAIPGCCEALAEYDVVKGKRQWYDGAAMSNTHSFGNKALSMMASILYGRRVLDVCSGLWAFRVERLRKFKLTSAGFTLEADMFINTVKTRCTLKELPIKYGKRADGDEAKLRFIDGLKIGWFLIRKRFCR